MISWYIKNPNTRGKTWYIGALSVGISLIFVGILMKIYFLSFVILIAGGIYLLQTNESEEISIEMSEAGIRLNGEFFSFVRLQSFSIETKNTGEKHLRIYFRDVKFIQDITIPVALDISESSLREFLTQYILEVPQKELHFSDRCIAWLKL